MSSEVWATEPDACLEPKIGEPGTPEGSPAVTVVNVFKETVRKCGGSPAMRVKDAKQGQKAGDGNWKTWSWSEYYADCRSFAKSLIQVGFEPHSCINIIGFNSPQWFISNMGSIVAGGIAAGIYTTNSPEACKYITEHSKARVVIVEGAKQLEKFADIHKELPELCAVVYWGEDNVPAVASQFSIPVHSFDDFLKLGANIPDADIDSRMERQLPGHCCTLIYTSGTTGPPKAAMISNDNVTWTARRLPDLITMDNNDRTVSYLPLSHIAAQMLDVHGPMMNGSCVFFAQPDALKGSLGNTLREVRPTIFFGVPRVWEKIREKMLEVGKSVKGIKRTLADWAKAQGKAKSLSRVYNSGKPAPSCYGCANTLVLSKVKAALGLDACKVCFSGAAPISTEVVEYFASLDIPIYELFGQSECTGPHTVNCPGAWKIGTCGRPLQGTESRLDPNTGELCYRGRHIFMGYMYNPEKTSETVDKDGFLHSGDIATFDRDADPDHRAELGEGGFLSITGRIKELIITAGGENVPPVLIEEELKRALPCLANCMVVGDRRKFLTVLFGLKVVVTPDGELTQDLTAEALEASEAIGSPARTVPEVVEDEKWQSFLMDGIKAANGKTTSRAQIVQKFAILPYDFTEKGGELTPTLKLKRSVVEKKYTDVIEGLYA